MDNCEDCGRAPCRACHHHFCCEPCEHGQSHPCRCECDAADRRMTYAD